MSKLTKEQLIEKANELIEDKNVLKVIQRENENSIADLTDKNKQLENTKERFLNEANIRAEMINNILRIISGKASNTSKIEILEDIFRPQLDKIKEIENHVPARYNQNMNFLSDKVIEDNRRFAI